jgi:hypothetical protein
MSTTPVTITKSAIANTVAPVATGKMAKVLQGFKAVTNPKMVKNTVSDLLAGKPSLETYARVGKYMGILMPNVFVAPIRYFVADETKEVRTRMFARDAFAGGLGIVIFYAVMGGMSKVLTAATKKPKPAVDMIATFLGWVANVAFQSVGAVKMSEWMSRQAQQKKALQAPNILAEAPIKKPSAPSDDLAFPPELLQLLMGQPPQLAAAPKAQAKPQMTAPPSSVKPLVKVPSQITAQPLLSQPARPLTSPTWAAPAVQSPQWQAMPVLPEPRYYRSPQVIPTMPVAPMPPLTPAVTWQRY